MMLFLTNRKFLQSHQRTLSVLVFTLLTHFCRGQPQLIGSSQPIVAALGRDIILPCQLDPAEDAADSTVEWARPDLNPRFVHVRRSGEELVGKKHKSFEGRTSLFIKELTSGNVSLKLSKVKLTDAGTYKCFIPTLNRQSLVQLVVGAASSPVLTLAGVDQTTRGVVLQCESPGWYPEPEVLWLDGEGNVLSAGPTETVRGPDDLYTVSSRVTVEKRHSNSFSCRVQQKNINQTRETTIHVPDEFFQLQSSCGVPIITALSVCLAVCILIILFLLFFIWKQKQNKNKKKKSCEMNRAADQFVPGEERGRLMGAEKVQMEVLKGKKEKKSKDLKLKKRLELQLQEEQRRREEAEREVQTLKEELETKNNQLESLQRNSKHNPKYSLVHDNQMENLGSNNMEGKDEKKIKDLEDKGQVNLHWKQTNEELKETKVQLKSKNEEISQLKRDLNKQLCEEKKKGEETDKELKELLTRNTEFEKKLQDERNKREKAEKELKNLKDQETELDKQLWLGKEKEKKAEKDLKELEKKLQDEKNKREKAEKEVKTQKKELETKVVLLQQQFHDEKIKREKAEKDVKNLKDQETKLEKKLQDERIKRERAEKEAKRVM